MTSVICLQTCLGLTFKKDIEAPRAEKNYSSQSQREEKKVDIFGRNYKPEKFFAKLNLATE